MDISDARAQQIGAIEQRLGAIQFATSSTVPAGVAYSTDYERAALLSSFGSDELDLRRGSVRELLKDCAVVVVNDTVRYVLDADVRRRVLRQLGSRERMRETLSTLELVPHEPLQTAINRIVNDEDVAGESSSIAWLQIAYRALSWFAGIIDTESSDKVLARIEAAGSLERFHRLVGDNFRGRTDELRELSEYVGVLPGGQGLITRVLERWMSFEQKPALVITGPGGIGKSTLLARFILDHASLTDDRRLPFAYINFDSPTVRAGDPKTILVDALRQLELQFPDNGVTIGAQRNRWQAAVVELSGLDDSAYRRRDNSLTTIFLTEFVRLLASIRLDRRPLLLVLDTFEIVQERQRGDIVTLYRFLRDLQREYPALRVVISGRAGLEEAVNRRATVAADARTEIPTRELRLRGLDRATSIEYLMRSGLTHDHAEQVARYLIPDEATDEGASPLSLRVAAEIWRRDIERSELDATFWAQLRAGRIQAQLITRYVRHTDPNSTAGRLALPALLLRRITPEALMAVVATAWDVPLEAGTADTVFADLGSLISLVIERAGRALEPRPEVQRQVVDLLSDLESTRVDRLHDLAVDHYAAVSERRGLGPADRDEARFDEIVHRLARGDDEPTVRSRWRDGCARFVTGRLTLLPMESQVVLDQLAGLELTEGLRGVASLKAWETDAIRRARHSRDRGDWQTVIDIASERDDWSRASELSLLLAQAYLARENPLDALDVAATAIRALEPGLASGLVCDLHQAAADAAYAADQPQDALDSVDDALAIAREREDAPRLVAGLILQVAVQMQRDRRAAATAIADIQSNLDRLATPLAEREMLRLFTLVEHLPTLVPATVGCGGLAFLSAAGRRHVARAITMVDEQVSAALGAPTGVLAMRAGLSVGKSVTRTWQDALERGRESAQSAVLEALRTDVPARGMLIDQLATAFGNVGRDGQPREADTVTGVRIKINQRRKRDLVAALLGEFGREEIEELVAHEFDRSLSSLTSLDEGDEHALTTLVELAEREQWIAPFVVAVRNRRPDAPRLMQIANELDLSTIHFSSSRLAGAAGVNDLDRVLARLGVIEGQIGRLERGNELIGTGLLVAPDMILVAASSLRDVIASGTDSQTRVRFGLKADSKGRRVDHGIAYPFHRDWLIDEVPYAGDSGFALVRVDGYPADEPLGSGAGQRRYARRGFADISSSADLIEGRNAFICWQQAARLELHIERRALTRAGDLFTVPSLGDSSDGSPCFSRSMDFLGLVLDNRAGVARIVPGADLWQSLIEHGHGDAVGVALA
jgi:hypothetical protein